MPSCLVRKHALSEWRVAASNYSMAQRFQLTEEVLVGDRLGEVTLA